mmetsp:Transcript_122679/g.212708  ORF Transcript_122679/g.212708 Transcript_122679/m.212708 type:complete len:237 (-) Transcript_122679:873-1583(-)
MVCMDRSIRLRSGLHGGLMQGLSRVFLQGEDAFVSTFTAEAGSGEIVFASSDLGDLAIIVLDGTTKWHIQRGGFLCASPGVQLSSQYQGLRKGIFSEAGLFTITATGFGQIVLSSFGSIMPKELQQGQQYVVDNGHLVAWSSTAEYDIITAGGKLVTSFMSGEGFACKFRGPGRIYIQSHQCPATPGQANGRRGGQASGAVGLCLVGLFCCMFMGFIVIFLVAIFMGHGDGKIEFR